MQFSAIIHQAILIIMIQFLNTSSQKEKNDILIWTKQTHVNHAISFEKSLVDTLELLDKRVYLSKNIFPNLEKYEIGKPVIVLRNKEVDFLPVYTEYFFTKKDSLLRYVCYNWEKERYANLDDKRKIWEEEKTKIEQYNGGYEKIKKTLISSFGEPTEQDFEPTLTKSQWGGQDYLSRQTIWNKSNVMAILSLTFASNTYRIRLSYYWK